MHGSQILAIVPKKDLKRTCQAYTARTFYLLGYMEDVFSKLKRKWWSNYILVACWYQYQLTIVGIHLKQKMASLIATWRVYRLLHWSSHIAIRGTAAKMQLPIRKILLLGAPTLKCCSHMDFKVTHNNGKDLLTNRKDPLAELKDLKGLLFKNLFPRTLKDPGSLDEVETWGIEGDWR